MYQQKLTFVKLPPVIGIAGRARSGKDTLADMLLALYGGYRYAFADPIRKMLLAIGIDMSDPYWIDKKEEEIPALGRSPRYLMQTLGTEWGREMVHPRLWVYLAAQQLFNRGRGMIISDVRFEDEAEWIRQQGGLVIHITRSSAKTVNPHASETGVAVIPHDVVVFNDGSLEDLQQTVWGLFNGRIET